MSKRKLIYATVILLIFTLFPLAVYAAAPNPSSVISDTFQVEVQQVPTKSAGFVAPQDGASLVADDARNVRVEFYAQDNSGGNVSADSYRLEYAPAGTSNWNLIGDNLTASDFSVGSSNGKTTYYLNWNGLDTVGAGQYVFRISGKNKFGYSDYTLSGTVTLISSQIKLNQLVSPTFAIKETPQVTGATYNLQAVDASGNVLKTVTLTGESLDGRDVFYSEIGEVTHYSIRDDYYKRATPDAVTHIANVQFQFTPTGEPPKNEKQLVSDSFALSSSAVPPDSKGFITPTLNQEFAGSAISTIPIEWYASDDIATNNFASSYILEYQLNGGTWTQLGTYNASSLTKGYNSGLTTYKLTVDARAQLGEGNIKLRVTGVNKFGNSNPVASPVFQVKFRNDIAVNQIVSPTFALKEFVLPPLQTPTLAMTQVKADGTEVAYTQGTWATNPVKATFRGSEYSVFPSPKVHYQFRLTPTSEWQDWNPTNPFRITIQGSTTLYYRAVDEIGNVSSDGTATIQLDSIAPQLNITQDVAGSTITIHVSATDSGTGIDHIVKPDASTTTLSTFDYVVSAEGQQTFVAYDVAGNQTTLNYFADITPPTISVTKTGSYLDAKASDTGSGIKHIKYGTNDWIEGNEVIVLATTPGNYIFTAEDKSGNTYSTTFVVDSVSPPSTIDTQAPQIFFSKSGNNITAFAIDDMSGVKSMTDPDGKTINGNSIIYTATTPGSYTFATTDNAGNVGTKSFDVTEIVGTPAPTDDTNKPLISDFLINYGATQTSSNSVLLSLLASDDVTLQQNLQVEFTLDGTTWYGFDGTSFKPGITGIYQTQYAGFDIGLVPATKYITVKVTDETGNFSTKIASIQLTGTNLPSDSTGTLGTGSIGSGTGTSPTSPILIRDPLYSVNLTNVQGNYIEYSLDGISWSPWENVKPDKTASKLVNFMNLDGMHMVSVRTKVVNGASETLSDIGTYYFMLDRTAPEANISTINGALIAVNGSITFLADVSDNVSTAIIADIAIYDKSNTKLAEVTNVALNTNSSNVIPISNLAVNNYYYIVFKIKDEAGNTTKKMLNVLSK